MSAKRIVSVLILGITLGTLCAANQSTSKADQLYWEAVELHAQGKAAEALAKIKSAVRLASGNKTVRDYMKELEAAVAVEDFDRHALQAPPEAEKSVDALAKYLVEPAKSDREKVRLIFRWITDRISYDTQSYFSGTPTETDAEGTLRTRTSVCEGYSNLFEALCKAAGVTEVKIVGYAKGYSYRNGAKFDDTNHAWNAVQLDGQWWIIDSTWGAGNVEGKTFVKELKEFYYLTPPDIFLYSHLPEDPQYQYVKTPITKEQFEAWPKIDYKWFTLGVKPALIRANLDKKSASFPEIYDHPAARIKIIEAPLTSTLRAGNKAVLRIEAPGAMEVQVINNNDFIKMELKKFGVYEAALMPKKGKLSISARLPGKGDSFWTILAYHVD